MSIERIRKFDIAHRPFITGIYGKSDEYFLDSDLHKYSFKAALYRQLRSEGWNTIFYSITNNFYSFEEDPLKEFFNLQRKENATQDICEEKTFRRAKFTGPLGKMKLGLPKQSVIQSESLYESINVGQLGGANADGTIFRVLRDELVFDSILNFGNTHQDKQFVIVLESFKPKDDKERDIVLEKLKEFSKNAIRTGKRLRITVLYTEESSKELHDAFDRQPDFIHNKFFRTIMGMGDESSNEDINDTLFYIQPPLQDEVRNLINRRRLLDGLDNAYSPTSIEQVSLNLWQNWTSMQSKRKDVFLIDMDAISTPELHKAIAKIDTEKAMDKLNKLQGIENIVEHLQIYLDDLRDWRKNQKGVRMRPHMVFVGHPGTGKTTVARLFAEILREEGLLSKGHLIEAKVEDLIGQYVGETRIKTKELCNRAKGGILFIDEAYGLMSSHNSNGADYGKEAIEVLIQYMENEPDAIVIIAGYEDEILDLIHNGNKGFERRFGGNAIFKFHDYKPDVLFNIAKNKLDQYEFSEQFLSLLQKVLNYEYQHRKQGWGNAGSVENICQEIVSRHRQLHGASKSLEADSIPEKYQTLVSNIRFSDNDILDELNGLIGLRRVKDCLNDLLVLVSTNKADMERLGTDEMDKPNLNFIFSGNPGTGKTTVARLLGKIFYAYGVLDSDKVLEKNAGDIINGIVGGDAQNINKLFDEANGGVLFIDEAYQLLKGGAGAIDQLVANLTSTKYQGNMAVVMAGYPKDMNDLLHINAGLHRRFEDQIIDFEDYTADELWKILLFKISRAKPYIHIRETDCYPFAIRWFEEKLKSKDIKNAGFCDELLKSLRVSRGRRLQNDESNRDTFLPQDFPNYNDIKVTL